MHYVYKATMRTSKHGADDDWTWHFDSREEAVEIVGRVIELRRSRGQYVGSVQITPILAAGDDSAFDYNYPETVRVSSRKKVIS